MKFKGVNSKGQLVFGEGYVKYNENLLCLVNNLDDLKNADNIIEENTLCESIKGFYDKNNNILYNNDIIKISLNDIERYFLISFRDGAYNYINGNNISLLKDVNLEFEIIGNKFIDKDLLNKCLRRNE